MPKIALFSCRATALATVMTTLGGLVFGAPNGYAQPSSAESDHRIAGTLPEVIAFGSCLHQDSPKPVLDVAMGHQPDVFLFLGDNIYADTNDPDVLRSDYGTLAASAEFRRVLAGARVLATWDDHDYWANDGGRHHPNRLASEAIFEDFWGIAIDSPIRQREGIYGSWIFVDESSGGSVQIIMLDTRYFRDDLVTAEDERFRYLPNPDPTAVMLGDAQWSWLDSQLAIPADVRLIGSSIQVSHEHNGYESWTNVPHEQMRLLELLGRATGRVLVVSGDLHQSDISVRRGTSGPDGITCREVWDVTSSNLNRNPWREAIPNRFRAIPDDVVLEGNHFGLVRLDWTTEDPQVIVEIRDQNDRVTASLDLNQGRVTPPRD